VERRRYHFAREWSGSKGGIEGDEMGERGEGID